MNLSFKPFNDSIKNATTAITRRRYADSQVIDLDLSTPGAIHARVSGTRIYDVSVHYNEQEVLDARCSCPFDQEGYCKHIVNVLVTTDAQMKLNPEEPETNRIFLSEQQEAFILTKDNKTFILHHKTVLDLSEKEINDIAVETPNRYWLNNLHIETARFLANKMTAEIIEYYGSAADILIEQKKDQIQFQKFLKGKDEGHVKTASLHILQGLTKLRQICNCPSLLSDDEFYGSQSAKTDELMRQIQKLQGDHKILVFSQFVGMLNIIRDKLDKEKIKYAYLSGQTQKRQAQVDLFQEDDDVRVFLISLKAGGSGLKLTKAEYVFLVDPWWNPAVENQAIDRAYRIGQDKKVIAIRLITPDSVEEKIMKLQEQKKSLVEDLIRAESGFFKKLTKDDLLALV